MCSESKGQTTLPSKRAHSSAACLRLHYWLRDKSFCLQHLPCQVGDKFTSANYHPGQCCNSTLLETADFLFKGEPAPSSWKQLFLLTLSFHTFAETIIKGFFFFSLLKSITRQLLNTEHIQFPKLKIRLVLAPDPQNHSFTLSGTLPLSIVHTLCNGFFDVNPAKL